MKGILVTDYRYVIVACNNKDEGKNSSVEAVLLPKSQCEVKLRPAVVTIPQWT